MTYPTVALSQQRWLNLTKYLFDNKEDITDVRGTIHHNGPLADGWGVTCLLEMMAYLK